MKTTAKRKSTIRFFGWGNKGRKLSKPDTESGKLKWADFTLCIAAITVVKADKFNWIPNFPYKEEVIIAVAIVLILLSYFNYYHKLCPASRWERSSWATGMTAVTWCVVPLICYATGINSDWERMWHISAYSVVMWIVFIFCRYNLYRVRKRAKAEIAMIEWRERNKKNRR